MTPDHLLFVGITLALSMGAITLLSIQMSHRAILLKRLMQEKLLTATERFQNFKTSLLEANEGLLKQLVASEKVFFEVRDQLEYQKRENASYIKVCKQLEEERDKFAKAHYSLLDKYNALTLKRQFDDDMPT